MYIIFYTNIRYMRAKKEAAQNSSLTSTSNIHDEVTQQLILEDSSSHPMSIISQSDRRYNMRNHSRPHSQNDTRNSVFPNTNTLNNRTYNQTDSSSSTLPRNHHNPTPYNINYASPHSMYNYQRLSASGSAQNITSDYNNSLKVHIPKVNPSAPPSQIQQPTIPVHSFNSLPPPISSENQKEYSSPPPSYDSLQKDYFSRK